MKHTITDSDTFDTVVFKNSDINNGAVIISIFFHHDVEKELLEYRERRDEVTVKFFDFFGFDKEFRYLFNELRDGTTLSKKEISDIVRSGNIQSIPKENISNNKNKPISKVKFHFDGELVIYESKKLIVSKNLSKERLMKKFAKIVT